MFFHNFLLSKQKIDVYEDIAWGVPIQLCAGLKLAVVDGVPITVLLLAFMLWSYKVVAGW